MYNLICLISYANDLVCFVKGVNFFIIWRGYAREPRVPEYQRVPRMHPLQINLQIWHGTIFEATMSSSLRL